MPTAAPGRREAGVREPVRAPQACRSSRARSILAGPEARPTVQTGKLRLSRSHAGG